MDDIIVANYADDTAPYSATEKKLFVKKEIEHFSEVIFQWFDFNYMKIKVLMSTVIQSHLKKRVYSFRLGIALDSRLCFDDHINNLCKNATSMH